ncbi:MAG: hypothetical protein HYU64_03120 [Armatimonadetes bacterium]|nr:hypothetical protein [Armatimonadota bacterium]
MDWIIAPIKKILGNPQIWPDAQALPQYEGQGVGAGQDSSSLSALSRKDPAVTADNDIQDIVSNIQSVYELAKSAPSAQGAHASGGDPDELPSPNFTDLAAGNFVGSIPPLFRNWTDQGKQILSNDEKFHPELRRVNDILGRNGASQSNKYMKILQMGIRDAQVFEASSGG